jgi:hypothetical protein
MECGFVTFVLAAKDRCDKRTSNHGDGNIKKLVLTRKMISCGLYAIQPNDTWQNDQSHDISAGCFVYCSVEFVIF